MNKHKWTDKEKAWLKQNYPIYGFKYCAEKLGLNEQQIISFGANYGLRRDNKYRFRWTKDQIQFLIENYTKNGKEYCSKNLNISLKRIKIKARFLQLKPNFIDNELLLYSDKDIEFIKENYPKFGSKYCAENLSFTRSQIREKANDLKIKYQPIIEKPGFKTCCDCKQEKIIEDYTKIKHGRLGLLAYCKKCHSKREHKRVRGSLTLILIKRYRGRTKAALKGLGKPKSVLELLGCTKEFFIEYIKSLMTPDMTLEDLMCGKIHIDHIIPCKAFDLNKIEEQKKCFHYTNLRPLWGKDNLNKSDILPNGKSARFIKNV